MAIDRTVCRIVTFCRDAAARLCHVVVVVADVREIPSRLPRRLEEIGVEVVRRRLPVGDYIVGPGAVVERKTVFDFHQSLVEGRLWKQLGQLRNVAWPYLLIEGADFAAGPIGSNSLKGVWLAASDLGVVVLRSKNRLESSEWLHQLAARRQQPTHRDRPTYAQRFGRAPRPHPAEAALAAAPSISVKTARSLLGHFGSLYNVITASPAEWQSVPGVGPHRSQTLRQMVHSQWHPDATTSHPDASRKGHRAT
jgi:ERCC4-type nuclease